MPCNQLRLVRKEDTSAAGGSKRLQNGTGTGIEYFRKDVAARLIPLGAAGSPAPGAWNDRLAIAKALSALPRNARLDEAIARLESEAAGGKGTLWVRVRKLSCRLAAAYFRSLFSRSPSAARTRAFAVNAFTHIGS